MEKPKQEEPEIVTECLCKTSKGVPCGVCRDGNHIFCNRYPHGLVEEAIRWFVENPDALESVSPLNDCGKAVVDEAKKRSDKE